MFSEWIKEEKDFLNQNKMKKKFNCRKLRMIFIDAKNKNGRAVILGAVLLLLMLVINTNAIPMGTLYTPSQNNYQICNSNPSQTNNNQFNPLTPLCDSDDNSYVSHFKKIILFF